MTTSSIMEDQKNSSKEIGNVGVQSFKFINIWKYYDYKIVILVP